jgi:hypothetical protein
MMMHQIDGERAHLLLRCVKKSRWKRAALRCLSPHSIAHRLDHPAWPHTSSLRLSHKRESASEPVNF